MRPSDLARGHGLSAQAVRNYERDGFLPPADRTPSGYRIYTEVHAAALRAFLALVPAFGHAAGGRIMNAVHDGDVDDALLVIDRGHEQVLRDRETLTAVKSAVDHLMAEPGAERPGAPGPLTIGELAHRLDVTPATLRNWEGIGILVPARDPATGYRVFRASDVRDAELAHLLRRGGYPLEHIATVVRQVRTAGGTGPLAEALDDWRRRLTARGLAMLAASGELSRYLDVLDRAGWRTDPGEAGTAAGGGRGRG
ncbi:TioE family transcriptional regulator [Actinomadura verrucosospora]|uniref:TioE family transcriptional regulator n=1 Tax=Actinomadura sp. NPDC048021 TaxID=3155385 RepID=UPI0031EBDBDD